MDYRLDIGMWNQVFAVPSVLADRHLKLAGKEQLQVILWVLRNAGQSFSPESMAEALGMPVELALDALEYWCDRGLLAQTGELLSPVPQPEAQRETAPGSQPAPGSQQVLQPEKQPEKPVLPPRKRLARPDGQHLTTRMAESETMRFLMQEAETTLGKTLSPAMSTLLLTITDDYGLPAEVTVMLLHYAQEVGRTSTTYIDTVARDWAESSIFSIEAAEAKLQQLTRSRLAWGKVSSAAGLVKRSPSKSEEEKACRWVYDWSFSPEMLRAAYDACVDHTGKFSAPYMDRVLTGWHNAGVRNLQELDAYNNKSQSDQNQQQDKSYDINELERMSSLRLPKNL